MPLHVGECLTSSGVLPSTSPVPKSVLVRVAQVVGNHKLAPYPVDEHQCRDRNNHSSTTWNRWNGRTWSLTIIPIAPRSALWEPANIPLLRPSSLPKFFFRQNSSGLLASCVCRSMRVNRPANGRRDDPPILESFATACVCFDSY
jgi:hypothetical protein